VTILNSRSVSSGKTWFRKGQKAEKHTYFHQLNSRKLLVVFKSAISEGLQLYRQILNLTVPSGTLTAISSKQRLAKFEIFVR
jgi:hypothetical protein